MSYGSLPVEAYIQDGPSKLSLRYLPPKNIQLDATTSEQHIMNEILHSQLERSSKLERLLGDPNLAGTFPRGDNYYDELQAIKIVSPIRLLPSEVLLHVFQEYMHLPDPPTPKDCICAVNFLPWILSQVCQEWRRVVFSSSSLWAKVDVNSDERPFLSIGESTPHNLRGALHLLSQQMILSANQPLDVTFDAGSDLVKYYPEVYDILHPHRHRWRVLSVCYDGRFDPESPARILKLFLGSPLEFSQLESMTIKAPAFVLNMRNDIYFPRIQYLHLCMWNGSTWPSTIPWHNLTTLHLFTTRTTQLLAILPSLTNLTQLVLEEVEEDSISPIPPAPIVLPRLDTLFLYPHYASAICVLSAPSLEHLSIGNCKDEDDEPNSIFDLHSIVGMIHRSDCSISTLRMGLPMPTLPSLHDFLSAFPKLTEIDVALPILRQGQEETTPYLVDFAGTLSAKDTTGNFSICPLLEEVNLLGVYDSHCFEEQKNRTALLEMLASRSVAPTTGDSCCLNLLGLDTMPKADGGLAQALDTFRDGGLYIRIPERSRFLP